MKALVVDDDRVLADLVAFTLRRAGYQVVLAFDGEAALRRWEEEHPDAIILDVNLPKSKSSLNGFELCRRIRQVDDVPIIMLTVRGEEDDIIQGLELGADDYVLKPFSPRQLVARLEAVMRRSSRPAAPALQQVGVLSLDANRREVRIGDDKVILLTILENRLLEYLMLNAGHVLTYEDIVERVWGAAGGDRDMLRQLIRRLRLKVEPDPAHPRWIETIPGLGYGLVKAEE